MRRICWIAIFLGSIIGLASAQGHKPRTATQHNHRGNQRAAQGDKAGAIADYSMAIALRPKDAEGYFNRGNLLYSNGDLVGAVADYTRVISLEPANAAAYLSRAAARRQMGDLGGAHEDSVRAAAINPNAPDVANNLTGAFSEPASSPNGAPPANGSSAGSSAGGTSGNSSSRGSLGSGSAAGNSQLAGSRRSTKINAAGSSGPSARGIANIPEVVNPGVKASSQNNVESAGARSPVAGSAPPVDQALSTAATPGREGLASGGVPGAAGHMAARSSGQMIARHLATRPVATPALAASPQVAEETHSAARQEGSPPADSNAVTAPFSNSTTSRNALPNRGEVSPGYEKTAAAKIAVTASTSQARPVVPNAQPPAMQSGSGNLSAALTSGPRPQAAAKVSPAATEHPSSAEKNPSVVNTEINAGVPTVSSQASEHIPEIVEPPAPSKKSSPVQRKASSDRSAAGGKAAAANQPPAKTLPISHAAKPVAKPPVVTAMSSPPAIIASATGGADSEPVKTSSARAGDNRRAQSYLDHGIARFEKMDIDGAISDFDSALRVDPKLAAAYYHRGAARGAQGKAEAEIADYTRAIAADPGYAEAYVFRGYAQYGLGNSDAALADYDKAIVLNPAMARPYAMRGLALLKKGKESEADANFKKALELDPGLKALIDNVRNERRARKAPAH